MHSKCHTHGWMAKLLLPLQKLNVKGTWWKGADVFQSWLHPKGLNASAVTNQSSSPWAEHVILSQGSEVTLSVCTFTMPISSCCLCPSFSQTFALLFPCTAAQTGRDWVKQSAKGLNVPLLTFDLSCGYF